MPVITEEDRREREKKRQRKEAQHRYYLRRKHRGPAADERRLSLMLRMPEYLVGLLHRLTNEAIATGNNPWKTISETARALIVMGLEQMKHDPEIARSYQGIVVGEQVHRLGEQRRQAEMIVNRVSEEVKRLLAIDNAEMAYQVYDSTTEEVHKMDPTVWRDWAIDQLEKRFPDLEKKVRGGKLVHVKLVPRSARETAITERRRRERRSTRKRTTG